MANEISSVIQLRVQNPAGSQSGYNTTLQRNTQYNQNALGAQQEIVSVPVTPTAYTFTALNTPGFVWLQNLDTVNFVLYGVEVAGNFYPTGMIEAGEVHFFRLNPFATFAMVSNLQSPPQPTVTTAATGGTIAAGTYQVKITYVNASGESLPSISQSVTTTGSTSTITIDSPVATGGGAGHATGWYAYVTQAGGNTFTRQQAAGSPTPIGTNLTLTAPPTSTGANPPAAATCAPVNVNILVLED